MNRLIIESIEGRVLAGITMFVAIMILIGWVAINEPARMASFESQQAGRSIERGGELYAANCATCHGANGYGQADLVPALNSPQFFGHVFYADVNTQIGRLQRQQAELGAEVETLTKDRDALLTEVSQATTTEARRTEITTEIQAIDARMNTDIEGSVTAQIAAYDAQLEPLIAERETIIDSMQAAIDKGYLPGIEAAREAGGLTYTDFLDSSADRLKQATWGSDVQTFVRTTLYHGRPGTAAVWQGKQMVAWAQVGGGPLRTDQIDDIVNFVANWDKGDAFSTDDLFAVNQFMKLKADAALVSAGPKVPTITEESVGDLDQAVTLVTALTGDATRGQALYEGNERSTGGPRLACNTCHAGGAQAPATETKWDTAVNVRIQLPEFAGWTPEKYMIDSIIYPNDYTVPGYASGVMPNNYGEQLSAQDLADILAYIKTYATVQ